MTDLGHNNPPENALVERLEEEFAPELERHAELMTAADNIVEVIETPEQSAAYIDFAAQLQDASKSLTAAHKAAKEPFLKSGKTVDAVLKHRADELSKVRKTVADRVGAFKQKEEAQATEAGGDITRTAHGSSASLKKTWQGSIADKAELDLDQLRPFLSDEALQKALNAAVKAGARNIAGAVIVEKATANLR